MFEIIKAGGWLMWPILICSVMALAISIERIWTLRATKIAPKHTLALVWKWIKNKQLDSKKLKELKSNSPLGEILAAGLANSKHGREIMKESISEAAARVIHELERYLNTLGTIAAIAPLLGLLGTVLGMIEVFNQIGAASAIGNVDSLAGGISKALITTAAGLTVAIPSLMFHRFFVRRVDELVVTMEQEATKLVEVVHGDREVDYSEVGKQ
ncbi:MotA/TolQ/ExbB proton channel family protein [Zooshikella sp. RANM57]|uniref:MotA/TolQ/ExbB proton channel family protein n=2 Tax=Zooshikella harenae TaxID=2827238 RepID=A0ABS5ZE21_9GAMM|nr:MotA/TolQ/ExbB proton channel family protein [Zooshikella harenae]MBU2711556.1 MotA/TolQ/ExbB proton channel family protein [Zooshikella harenae]